MSQHIFSGSSFNYYNPPFGDDGWVGSTSSLGDDTDASYLEAYTGESEPVRRAGVSVDDGGEIPTTITAISDVTVRYRGRYEISDQNGPAIIPGTTKPGITLQEGSDVGFTTVYSDQDRAFTTSSALVSWTRARVFEEVYYGQTVPVVNGGGTTRWSEIRIIVNFTQSAPTATTNAATNVTAITATLNGTINPNGSTSTFDTEYRFEYGLTAAYGTNTTLVTGQTGSSNIPVTAEISGLTPSTTYHYRVVALNDDNTVNGTDQTFTTNSMDEALAFF